MSFKQVQVKSKWCIFILFFKFLLFCQNWACFLFNDWKGLTYFDGLVVSHVNSSHTVISRFRLKVVIREVLKHNTAFQQQVGVVFFSWKLFWWTNRDRFVLTLFWLRVMSWNIKNVNGVGLLMTRLHTWFQSDVCELEIVFLFFFFFLRLRLSTCQSEHLCKRLVSLTAIYSNTFWKCL